MQPNQPIMAKCISKTKNAANKAAGFLWSGLFHTKLVKAIEPGKFEDISTKDELKKIDYKLLL